MNNRSIIAALASVAVAGVLLTGCSAVSAVANEQTKIQACAKIKSSFNAVGTTMSKESATLATDPKDSSAKISAAAVQFSKSANSLTNASVRKAAQAAAVQLTKFSKDVSGLQTDATAASTKLEADLTPLQASFSKVSATCKL